MNSPNLTLFPLVVNWYLHLKPDLVQELVRRVTYLFHTSILLEDRFLGPFGQLGPRRKSLHCPVDSHFSGGRRFDFLCKIESMWKFVFNRYRGRKYISLTKFKSISFRVFLKLSCQCRSRFIQGTASNSRLITSQTWNTWEDIFLTLLSISNLIVNSKYSFA